MATGETKNRVDKWEKGWKAGWTKFHLDQINEFLLQFYDRLTDGKQGLIFYLPLCGKTLDIKWLADKGHEVIGVEGVQMALEQFFEEQQIKYSISDIPGIPNGKLYTSEDGKIRLYKCDYFELTKDIMGQVDAVWDRGALVAVDPEDKVNYVKHMKTLMKPGAKSLIEVYEYDVKERDKMMAPYPAFPEEMKQFHADWSKVEELTRLDRIEFKGGLFRTWGLTWMTFVSYLVTA